MRPDQRIRLMDVSERLAEVVIDDADPQNWAASGIPLNQMDRAQRGDAVWCRKAATQSLVVLSRVLQVLSMTGDAGAGRPGERTEEEIAADAERQAAELLERLGRR